MDARAAWDAYAETVLHLPGGARVDLRRPPGAAEVAALATLGLGARLSFVTPENPRGRGAPPGTNARRLSALEAELDARGVPYARVDGTGPDGSHRERLVAAPLAPRDATELARRFDQLALFHFDGARFWLLGAELDAPPRPLPAARPPASPA